MNPEKIPKKFCDSVSGGFTKEYFVVLFSAGENASAYALTPQHAKRLSQWMAHHIAQYEKNVGKIDAEWNPNIKSPLQPSDLPDDSGRAGGGTGIDSGKN